jgi:hypothetical protein
MDIAGKFGDNLVRCRKLADVSQDTRRAAGGDRLVPRGRALGSLPSRREKRRVRRIASKAGHSALAMDIQGIALSIAEQRRLQWRS